MPNGTIIHRIMIVDDVANTFLLAELETFLCKIFLMISAGA